MFDTSSDVRCGARIDSDGPRSLTRDIAPIRAVLARYVTAAKPVDLEEAAANFTPQWCDSHRLKLMPEAREGS